MPAGYEILEAEGVGYEVLEPEPPKRAPSLFDEFGPFANVPRSSEERALQTFQSGLPQGITPEPTEGILSAFGVTPESIPSGKGPVTIPLASVARAGVGIADYLSSFQGIQELVGSLTPAKLVVMAKWATDMAKGAGHEAGTLAALADKPNKTLEDWQKISDATVNLTAMGLGAGHLGSKVGEGVTGVRAPIGRALIEPVTIGRQATLAKDLAKKLQEAEGFGDLPVIPATAPTAERQLGIPIPEGMFVQPGIPPLADAALREAMQKVIVPGQEGAAANALRMALEPPELLQVEPRRLAERIPGGGQAPYGRVSFMREAEPPVPERTQNAIQRETETVLRDVREPEVPQEGAKPLPAAEVSAKAPETLEPQNAPPSASPLTKEAAVEPTKVGEPTAAKEPPTETPVPVLFVKDGNRLTQVTPQRASEIMSEVRDRTGLGSSGLDSLPLYDVNGKPIGFASYNGNVWLGDSKNNQLIYKAAHGEKIAPKPEPERIVETAVRNPETGQVASGKTIHVLLYPKVGLDPVRMKSKEIEQASGYLTSTGRFVTQAEADKIAEASKQIEKGENLSGETVSKLEQPQPPRAENAAKELEGELVYHATTRGNANKIRSEGIAPGSWFAKTPKEALAFAKDDPNAVIFAVRKSDIASMAAEAGDVFGQEFQKSGVFDRSSKSHVPIGEVVLEGDRYVFKPQPPRAENAPGRKGAKAAKKAFQFPIKPSLVGKSLEESKAVREKWEAELQTWEAALPESERIVLKNQSGNTLLTITKEPSGKAWRSTAFDADTAQPRSHMVFPSRLAALREHGRWTRTRESPIPPKEAKPAPKAETPKPTETTGGDIVSKLESLKFKEGDEGLAGAPETLSAGLNLPHPEVLKAIGRSTWNTAIDIAIASIKAGRAVKLAIEDALSHIRKNAAGKFDEAQAKANLDYILRSESESKTYPVEGESVKMRKSAERATTSEMVPEPVQETIKTAPESFYTQQSMKRVEDAVGGMSETELSGVPRDSNLYTAAKLEQARRLFERGENDAGYAVFVELEKEGTRLGQLINQFKMLKGTRPEEIVRVVNTKLQKEGKDPLTKPQEAGVLDVSKKAKDADTALDKATDEWRQNPSDANAAKAEKALTNANDAAVNLQRKISKFSPRSTASVLKSVLQGNLLTPISEVANIVGNMSFLPFRAMDRAIASGLDVIDSFLRKKPREVAVQPVAASAEAVKGLGRGAKKIPDILLRGTGDVIKGETRAGLHPIRAWINQFAKNPEMPTTGGKLTLKDRLNLAIEGTLGVPAEAMLRGLGAGDIAFREAARARVVANELKLANVPRGKWAFAQKFPELFLDAEALSRIQTDTLAAIFQRNSKTLNLITGWLRGRGEWVDLLAATVAPYKLTPWNIVGEILAYNPLIAMARTVKEAKAGNSRQAKLNAGKFVVGSLLTTTGWWLYKNGLMSPSLDQRDEAQKARILAGQVLPPNHINLSGLKRKLAGGDPAFKPGDETVDVFRSGGLAGSAFYMTANIGRDLERQPESSGLETVGKVIRESTLEQARFGMNQSFLSGVEGLLAAIREGNVDNYLRQWGNTVASIPFPNTMTVLSRSTREYKPDFRAEGFQAKVENIVRNRLGAAKMDDYLPLKRGLWGEPLPETPKDRNALVYHFFDVFKNQQVTSDPVPLELYRLWRKTDDSRVIPSLVEKTITFGNKTYPLTAEQQSRYAELVGQSRRRIVDAVVVNPNFYKLDDEVKVKTLDQIYDAGLDMGKAMFWKEAGANLTPKPSRAGFVPAPRPELSVPDSVR